MKYLVIVESPAKKNKIQQFLNTIKGLKYIEYFMNISK